MKGREADDESLLRQLTLVSDISATIVTLIQLCRESPELCHWLWEDFGKNATVRSKFAGIVKGTSLPQIHNFVELTEDGASWRAIISDIRKITPLDNYGGLTWKYTHVQSHLIAAELKDDAHTLKQTYADKPDFVFPSCKVVVFVDGCFWHGHKCGKNILPKTNSREWHIKISGNRNRDKKVSAHLRRLGWHVLRIWECQLKKNPLACIGRVKLILASANP
jgi:DNA mismatch endonuclease (patch repair protein)